MPSTSRLQAGSGPSSETPLVPSQVGPERTRKRTKVPQVPSSNPGSSAPYPGVQVARPLHPTEFAGTSSILKTVAPILPDELDHAPAATSNYAQIGSSFPQEPNQELYQSSQLSDVLAIHPILDTSSSLDVQISAGQHSWELGHDNSTRGSYANNLYAYPSGIAVSDEPFITSNISIPSSHSCGYMLPHISQSDSQHLLADAANIVSHPGAETGSIALPTRLMAHTGSTGTASLSLPLSTTPGGPSSPIFSTLQHTHDPHFRPPTDVFAGLAYPRDRMSVPALGRGRSNHAESGHEASDAMGNIREEDSSGAQSRFQVADEYSYLHGHLDQVTERTPDEEVLNKTLSYTPETCDSGYGRELTEDSGYCAPSESAYSDYSSSTQPSGRYISQGTSSGLTTPISHHGLQDDLGYSPHTDFIYGSSEDPAYASQTDGYSSDVQTPAEITVLPPPSGRGLIDFLDGAGNGGQYDDLSGSGYISGVSLSDFQIGRATYEFCSRRMILSAILKLAQRTMSANCWFVILSAQLMYLFTDRRQPKMKAESEQMEMSLDIATPRTTLLSTCTIAGPAMAMERVGYLSLLLRFRARRGGITCWRHMLPPRVNRAYSFGLAIGSPLMILTKGSPDHV